MGAVYSVGLKLKMRNESDVIGAINQYIDDMSGKARFNLDGKDRNSLEDLLRIFLTDEMETLKPGEYYQSGFSASYGWEPVMSEMFKAIAEHLEDGSFMEIEPDNDYVCYMIKDGKVVQEEGPTMGQKLVKLAMGGYADCNYELNEDDLRLVKEIDRNLEGIGGTALYDLLEDICDKIDW